MRRLPLVLGILACCLLARSAPAQVLYAAVGDDAGNGLYTIDPLTSQPTLVGPIAIDGSQVGVTGLAIHPQTHVMYGVTTDLESPPELITIDPTTGNATLIGGVGLFAVPDITFSADGTLYGWQKGAAEEVVAPAAKASGRRALANPLGGLVRINLTTGAATFVGTPVSTQQQGCGLTSLLGVFYLSLQQASGPLLTVNPATGVTTVGPTMNGPGAPIAALASSPSGVLYGATNNGSLITINTSTGAVTTIGSNLPEGTDALVFTNSALGGGTHCSTCPHSATPGSSHSARRSLSPGSSSSVSASRSAPVGNADRLGRESNTLAEVDVAPYFQSPERADAGLSALARGVVGSEILRIAGEIRAMQAKGLPVCDLTIGDFDPRYFPIPKELLDGTREALESGQTNYPPAEGILPLREAVARLYERDLGLAYPVDSVVIAAGARPLLYGAYRTLVDPGETVIYPVPTWNNNHYAYLSGARGAPVIVSSASNFFPTPDQLREHLSTARLLILNSPLNPTGTVISKEALTAITTMVVEENRRREATRKKPLYFVFDQVYWTLTFGKAAHHTPVALVPESAPYVIFLDAISKAFCATGMRVGWGVMPPAVRRRMSDILGHVGAWAPKAEQVGVAALLNQPEAISAYRNSVRGKLIQRLEALYRGVMDMKNDGFPVDAIEPQGAIYLSARFDLFGRTVNGTAVKTNDDVRRLLLGAGIGAVPFQAFGLAGDTGWFRLAAGAVSMDDIAAAFPRLRALLLAAASTPAFAAR